MTKLPHLALCESVISSRSFTKNRTDYNTPGWCFRLYKHPCGNPPWQLNKLAYLTTYYQNTRLNTNYSLKDSRKGLECTSDINGQANFFFNCIWRRHTRTDTVVIRKKMKQWLTGDKNQEKRRKDDNYRNNILEEGTEKDQLEQKPTKQQRYFIIRNIYTLVTQQQLSF